VKPLVGESPIPGVDGGVKAEIGAAEPVAPAATPGFGKAI
jgi:hypothetical protein